MTNPLEPTATKRRLSDGDRGCAFMTAMISLVILVAGAIAAFLIWLTVTMAMAMADKLGQ